jgi:hypothetical protein
MGDTQRFSPNISSEKNEAKEKVNSSSVLPSHFSLAQRRMLDEEFHKPILLAYPSKTENAPSGIESDGHAAISLMVNSF